MEIREKKKTKTHQIPDWWRCKNCRFWIEFRDGVGWCNNERMERSIGDFAGGETFLCRILFDGDGFGCIYFEPKEESKEDRSDEH